MTRADAIAIIFAGIVGLAHTRWTMSSAAVNPRWTPRQQVRQRAENRARPLLTAFSILLIAAGIVGLALIDPLLALAPALTFVAATCWVILWKRSLGSTVRRFVWDRLLRGRTGRHGRFG